MPTLTCGCSTPEGDTDWFTESMLGAGVFDNECSTPEGDTDWFTVEPARRQLLRLGCSTPEGDTDWFTTGTTCVYRS